MQLSSPELLKEWEWHLPYVSTEERRSEDVGILKQISAARCCRVSYLKHDGTASSIEEDIALCNRLAASRPIHASPFEHQAMPDWRDTEHGWHNPELHGNLIGWIQYRKQIENSFK